MPNSVVLEPFTDHSAFGLVASDKSLEEILKKALIDRYTNDFFSGIAHWGLRERAIVTFFREIGGQWSAWQNKVLEDAFNAPGWYSPEDDMWEGDDRRYPLSNALDKDRRLEQLRAWQCAATLGIYANSPKDPPPAIPSIEKRDTQGIQYLFLNWVCIECMQWNRTLADVFLRQDVSKRVRAALRSTEWRAAVANQLARIDFHDYKGELLGLVLKLLVINWPEIKNGTVNPVDLYNDVLDVDKAIFGTKAAGVVPKMFDEALGDRWKDGIEAFAERERKKFNGFQERTREVRPDQKKWEIYFQKQREYTGTEPYARSFATNLITETIPNPAISDLLKLLY